MVDGDDGYHELERPLGQCVRQPPEPEVDPGSLSHARAGIALPRSTPRTSQPDAAPHAPSAATITFEARNEHDKVVYRSVPDGQYNPTVDQGGAGMPAVGAEQNGVFFH